MVGAAAGGEQAGLRSGGYDPRVLTIRLATYLVRDLDEAMRFFLDALGFELREDVTHEDGGRWVVIGPPGFGTGLHLVVAAPGTDLPAAQAGGDVAFILGTDDFAGRHRIMDAHGVRFLEEPRHEPYGTVAVFADPAGVRWDLLEPITPNT